MHNVCVNFGPTQALRGVNFDLRPGEIHALVGQNGAGKSTLLNVLTGTHLPNSGEMRIKGRSYAPKDPHQGRMAGLGMVRQELALAPHLTVAQNIALGMEPNWLGFLNSGEMRRRTLEALSALGHEISPDTLVSNLSIADQQLVEIARALASGADVIVLDEPTSSLTSQDTQRLFTLLRTLRNQGKSIIFVSHFLEEVVSLADRFTVLKDGSVADSGVMASTNVSNLVRLMIGGELGELYPHSMRFPGEVKLTVDNLRSQSVSSASLELHAGEVLGIFSLVGAGCSELAQAIFGLDTVRSGKVSVGTYSGTATPTLRWQQKVGYLHGDRRDGLALSLPIWQNIALTDPKAAGRFGFLSPKAAQATAKHWIKTLGIACRDANQPVGQLSGGNQQKVALSRLLEAGSEVLILVEPTKGVDVGAKAEIYSLIDHAATFGRSILMVSTYAPELIGTCDRIAVMRRGHLDNVLPTDQYTEHSLVQQASSSN
jgi:ribose transport system ATP-binding protein